jgi:hypothetical protein
MICRVCGKEKKPDEFSRNKTIKGGRAKICKPCERIRAKEYYKLNRARLIRKHKEWIDKNRSRHNEIVYNYLIRKGKIAHPGIRKKKEEE